MAGKLYGLGVGPGDPELLTMKALRLIRESDVIAVPGKEVKESVAYQIAKQAYPKLDEKSVIAVDMPMTKDKEVLAASHRAGADVLESYLKKDLQVAFLTLGDPTVYSTYLYLHRLVEHDGYPVEIVSGITSFCAAAARLNIGLVERSEALHVIPSTYRDLSALDLKGTKVLMKSGKKIAEVRERLKEQNADVLMVENCGMENEKVYTSAEEIPDDAGYYSLIIVKER